MVNEFPDLQGVMGGYYAKYDGEDKAVSTVSPTLFTTIF